MRGSVRADSNGGQRPALLPRPNLPSVQSPMFSLPPPNIGVSGYRHPFPSNNQPRPRAQFPELNASVPRNSSSMPAMLPQQTGIQQKLHNVMFRRALH